MAGLHEVLQPDDSSRVRVAGKAGVSVKVRDEKLVDQDNESLQRPWAAVVVKGSDFVDNRYQYLLLVFGRGVESVEEVLGRRR